MLGNIVGALVSMIVGWTLIPEINRISGNSYYGWIVFIATIIFSLAVLYNTYNTFLDYSNNYDEEYKDVEDKPHKQTYLEYVLERKQVERIMK